MRALDKKLFRDLWAMKGQALAIALVIVSGAATYVMLIGTMTSLKATRDRFYSESRFADLFATVKRAPEGLKDRIAAIPGVAVVETRVVAEVKLEVAGFGEPIPARLVSVPDSGPALLNVPHMRAGRLPGQWSGSEAAVSEAFAEAHGLKPGDTLSAVINGHKETIAISGIALSPEYVLQLRPGAMTPDYKRYAVLWMRRDALATAYDMKGAFNDLAASLSAGAAGPDVIAALDDLLDRYGGLGAYARADQLSHRFLTEEFKQLERSAFIYPAVFMAVAAFLLNVAVARMVALQREQIAALKAFGYTNAAVALHYLKFVLAVSVAGVAGGLAVGVWLGDKLAAMYTLFYRFPYLSYEMDASVAAVAAAISVGSAIGGAALAVRKAARLTPAEGMRPDVPARFRLTLADRLRLSRFFEQPTVMIMRNIERRPVMALLTVTGIAFSCAVMVAGTFAGDAVDYMIDAQFRIARRDDMNVALDRSVSRKALHELKGVSGVVHAEPQRTVAARLKNGAASYRTVIQGVDPGGMLYRILDEDLKAVTIPSEGILLTDYLAGMLGVRAGDHLTVEVLEGTRAVRTVKVAGVTRQYLGVSGYMDITALNALMREGPSITGAYLSVDAPQRAAVFEAVAKMPRAAGAMARGDEIRGFYETQAEFFLFFTFIASILAGTIAFGVVYNSARIALSERGRELASLRVLGYTTAEVSYILLGEFALLTAAAVPLGFLIGRVLSEYIAASLGSDIFRVPVVIGPNTYALAAAVVLASACLSGLIVRRRIKRLDLIQVLKARE